MEIKGRCLSRFVCLGLVIVITIGHLSSWVDLYVQPSVSQVQNKEEQSKAEQSSSSPHSSSDLDAVPDAAGGQLCSYDMLYSSLPLLHNR